MARKLTAFQHAVGEFWTQAGLRPEPSFPLHPVRLIVDNMCIKLSDKDDTDMLLEAEILQLSRDRKERNALLGAALKTNLGLLLDSRATIHLSRSDDRDLLTARAIHPYTVNATGKLIRAIEDIAALVDDVRRSAAATGLSRPEAIVGPGQPRTVIFP